MLKEILRHTSKTHTDGPLIELAISRLHRVAEIINDRKRESELFNSLLELQTKITGLPQVCLHHISIYLPGYQCHFYIFILKSFGVKSIEV
jgi:hypothetical protein